MHSHCLQADSTLHSAASAANRNSFRRLEAAKRGTAPRKFASSRPLLKIRPNYNELTAKILDQKKKSILISHSTSVSLILRYADLFSSFYYLMLLVSHTPFSLKQCRDYWKMCLCSCRHFVSVNLFLCHNICLTSLFEAAFLFSPPFHHQNGP